MSNPGGRLYQLSRTVETINEEFLGELQEEIAREQRLIKLEEAERESLPRRIEALRRKLLPVNNLRSIPSVVASYLKWGAAALFATGDSVDSRGAEALATPQ